MSTFRWDELSVDYGSAIGRVYNALHENGISLTHSEVHDAVFISFDELDFAFVYALLQPTDSRKWCLISAGAEAGEAIVGGGYAQHNITDNLPEAIGFVIKEIDRTRVYPTAVTVVVDTIEFFSNDGLIARVEPMVFDDVSPQQRKRGESVLRGIRHFGETERLHARLRDLPGLELLSSYRHDDGDSDTFGKTIHKISANLCLAIRRSPKETCGVDVKQSLAQDLAAAFGETERLHAPLRDLPGLELLSSYRHDDGDSDTFGPTIHKTSANLCLAMRRSLKETCGVDVKQSLAQDLVAAFFGVKSWQHLIANAHQKRVWTQPVSVVRKDETANQYELKHYRTAGEALWAFAQTFRSWRGEPLVAACGGCSGESDALNMFTHKPGETGSPIQAFQPETLYSHPLPLVDCDDAYLKEASAIVSVHTQMEAKLRERLGIGKALNVRVSTTNRRLGVSRDKEMWLDSWLFTVHEECLYAEKFDKSGKRVSLHIATINEADISKDSDTGDMWVFSQHHTRRVIPLVGLTSADIAELARFSGVSYLPQALGVS